MSDGKKNVAKHLELTQIRKTLSRTYRGKIDESDLDGKTEVERDRAFLSRAIAATAVRRLTNHSHDECAQSVIDGRDDNGIDAIALTDASHVWLVQAKWSDNGTAGFNTAAARALVEGLNLLEQRKFDLFNGKIDPFKAQLDSAFSDTNLKITLVIAVVGKEPLAPHTIDILERAVEDHHGHGPMLDYKQLRTGELLQQLKDDNSPAPVNATIRMTKWISRDTPFSAFLGDAAAGDIAAWYEEHGSKLFSQNIRQPLGLTPINIGIEDTLTAEPENFWYFNNGITVLCDEIIPSWPGRRLPNEPVDLTLHNVSVVNGAQTVTAIHEANQKSPAMVQDADVTVRIISLGTLDVERAEYAARITKTTNTQNDVVPRDFITLDINQALIREDFDLSLEKVYVYKRGEVDPPADSGCSLPQAAIALACAYRTPELAVRAKRSTDLLWEQGKGGAYPRLFGETPSAFRIWRCVLIHRAVGEALSQEHKRLQGRAADAAQRGDLLITHLIFQLLDLDGIDDAEFDLRPVLDQVPDLTKAVLSWLIHQVDVTYGQTSFLTSTFTNETKCRELARLVLPHLRTGDPVPELPANYQPAPKPKRSQRRPNAVPTLVNAQAIPDGTPLTYSAVTQSEAEATEHWLAQDGRRALAHWQNDRRKPLVWSYDGRPYSASGLIMRLWELAGWEKAPIAAQGPIRWQLDDKRTLDDLAKEVLTNQEEEG